MEIIDFTMDWVGQAAALAHADYEAERRQVPALPRVDRLPDLAPFAENGLGAAALEEGRLVGFLAACAPFENAFGSTWARGTFSPAHAHGAAGERRGAIYQRLYQAAAAKWVARGVASHGIALYHHDEAALRAMFTYGFGQRCVDAVRGMEPIPAPPCPGYTFGELEEARAGEAEPLRRMLAAHMGQSPCFMKKLPAPAEGEGPASHRGERVFAAWQGGRMAAVIACRRGGEHFAAAAPGVAHICCAFCLLQHRGRGVYQNLLNCLISTLGREGYTTLSVDYESINPAAQGFWGKYFQPYTAGVVRRVDEGCLGRME